MIILNKEAVTKIAKSRKITPRMIVCFLVLGLCLYSYIEAQNQVTEMRISIPKIQKDVKALREENTRLQYEIDQLENPQRLTELACNSDYSHLKYPLSKQVVTMSEGIALQVPSMGSEEEGSSWPKVNLAVGAKAP